ncbi:glycosyl transferase [Staphylococcus xylosus]|uniref:macrolide family glycosyltransferase n=1 Tax=Staphylococcus xylosus TaxID=1288 RepID=UPI000C34687D|nr:macrolide family glycosyltransferase [Staphylococcus xylosus]PKI04784.1 glycosyl transferase [Staphylococcus xylosus]
MAKVLFINPGSAGHVNPTVAVCKTLVEKGEEVVYYATDKFTDRLQDIGVEIRTFNSDDMMTHFSTYGRDNLFNVMNGLLNTTDLFLPKILKETKDEHYDYMIYDSMFGCGYMLAQKLGIPAISSITTFAHTKDSFDQFTNQLNINLSTEAKDDADKAFTTLKTHLEQTYDISIPSRFEVMNNPGDLNISYVTRNFQIHPDTFDNNRYFFAGPSVILPQPSNFMSEIDQSKPIIYISLGTVFNENIPFFNKCFKALADIDATVVVSIGETNRIEDFDEAPSNFVIKSSVPQIELLQYTSLFITHAGMNSANEAIMMGVPMLAFPQNADQPVVAQQIENLNIGQQLNSETFTVEQLKQTVLMMLDHLDEYQDNIAMIKDPSHGEQYGYELAVNKILEFRDTHCMIQK